MRCLESTRTSLSPVSLSSSFKQRLIIDPFDLNTDTRLPGEQYSLNQQCHLALGNGYRAYTNNKPPFGDVCRELWCSSGTWATPAHPALEGSSCGPRQSCYQGVCVDRQAAFAKSKIKMYNNRNGNNNVDDTMTVDTIHHKPRDRVSPSSSSTTTPNQADQTISSNYNHNHGPSFMRRVQQFLKTTISSVVKFFG